MRNKKKRCNWRVDNKQKCSKIKCGLSFAKFAMKKCVKMNSNKQTKYSHGNYEISMNHFMVELINE